MIGLQPGTGPQRVQLVFLNLSTRYKSNKERREEWGMLHARTRRDVRKGFGGET